MLILAKMRRRVDSSQQYQETLQQAFEICWANLHDDAITNDMQSLVHLSKTVSAIPSFQREAEILGSAQLYYLGRFSDLPKFSDSDKRVKPRQAEELEQTLDYSIYSSLQYQDALRSSHWYSTPPCTRARLGHKCVGSDGWRTWEHSPMYTCLVCTTSILCQECYDERIKRNNTPDYAGDAMDFCCDAGEYIKAPMEGWKGVRDGKIYIENEEPIEVEAFLGQIREKWKRSWDDFWKN